MMILWIKFQEFTTLLKHGIQDVDMTTPNVNIFELVMGKFISSEDISRRDALNIGNVIVNIGGITIINWPQVWNNAIFLAKRRVQHHGAENFRDRAYWTLSYTILIMRVDATTMNVFIMIKNAMNKNILFEDTIIRKISINHNNMIQYCFSWFCLAWIVSELENASWCSTWIYPLILSSNMHYTFFSKWILPKEVQLRLLSQYSKWSTDTP